MIHITKPNLHIPRNRVFRLGPLAMAFDPGSAMLPGSMMFASHLLAEHRDGDGKLINIHDLGSGKVTNVGVMAMANDWNWQNGFQTLKLANFHAWGTGTTAELASDIAMQTAAAPTNATAATGTQSDVTAALSLTSGGSNQQYKTVVPITAGSSLAITEWGLFTAATLSASTGTPTTATTATTATVTGTPYTVNAEQQLIIVTAAAATWGLIYSNTSSVLTVAPSGMSAGWWVVSNGTAATTPAAGAFTLQPVMLDHKTFAAINVVSGDTVTFTYSLTLPSGG